MNNTTNNANLIAIARDLATQSDSAFYQRGVIEMLANYLEIDYAEAVDLIAETKKSTTWSSDDEHFILVAFEVIGPKTMQEAQEELMALLPRPENKDNPVECWWIAMDERYDGSDNDSAEFVPGTGRDAWYRYHEQAGTPGITRPTEERPVNRSAPQYRTRSGYVITDYNRQYNYMQTLRDIQGHLFDDAMAGRDFIDRMNQLIAIYGHATVNDAADLLGIRTHRDGETVGWNERLSFNCIRPIKFKREHRLDLPTPTLKTV